MMNKKRKIVVIERKKSSFNTSTSVSNNWFKTIFMNRFTLSIASGITIGIIFGFISLYILNDSGQPFSTNSDNVSTSTPVSKNINSEEREPLTIPELYVVQLGLFQEVENANVSRNHFNEQQIDAVIWPRQHEYFIFHSIYLTEQKAKEKVTELAENGIDSFVKPWSVNIDYTHMTDEEYHSIQSFLTLWKKSFEQIVAGNEIQLNEWHAWLENASTSPFKEQIYNILEQNTSLEDRTMLLEIISLLEQYTSS